MVIIILICICMSRVCLLKTILKEVDASEIYGEGIFYVKVKDGQLSVEPYEYYDRDAVFIATAKVFTKLIEGKLNPVVAFTTGKFR